MTFDVDDTLDERQKSYGDYAVVARRAMSMCNSLGLYKINDIGSLSAPLFGMVNIVTKLARLANNPEHRDSWVDIIGYATLVLRYLDEQEATQ